MNRRFYSALLVVILVVGFLVYSAVTATAKSVVTVHELHTAKMARQEIRLGARVADAPILLVSEPERGVRFSVRDISQAEEKVIPVVFYGVMPDTLKAGRDVIVEGNFDGTEFLAKSLLTQCPSKYVPPTPGAKGNEKPKHPGAEGGY